MTEDIASALVTCGYLSLGFVVLVTLFLMIRWSNRGMAAGRSPVSGSYLSIEKLVSMIDGSNGRACMRILHENRRLFETSPGSTGNHQNWHGGYVDHVTDGMNVAVALYATLSSKRPLPFTLSDALLVFYLHDIEKPWRYAFGSDGQLRHRDGFKTKEDAHDFRAAKLKEYGIRLSTEQQNGLRYVEGELDDYSGRRRVMGPLAAFCHLCDVTGARIWFDRPTIEGDPWVGATRRRTI